MWVCCLERRGKLLCRNLKIEQTDDTELIGIDFYCYSSPNWLLADKLMLKSFFCCHSTQILYVFNAPFSSSQTEFCCLIWVLFDSFLYPLQSLSSLFLFYFISTLGTLELTTFFVLDLLPSKLFHNYRFFFSLYLNPSY